MAMLSEMMNWRYSTKVFDKTKKIDEKIFDEIMESLRMAPSSYGLQPWKFLVIRDENIRAELRPFSWNQGQITDASHLIVFCAHTKIDADYVEKYIDLVAKTRNIDKEKISAYKDMMINNVVKGMSDEKRIEWAKNQCFIALGNLLSHTAMLKIDSCAIGGFEAEKYDEILGLRAKNLTATVVCPIGYRSDEDKYQTLAKVRFDKKDAIEVI